MKALLRASLLALLVFGIYAGISSAATGTGPSNGPIGFPRPQCPNPQ